MISQSPSAGSEVEAGSTVAIVVSAGKEQAQVPNVIGKLRAEAVRGGARSRPQPDASKKKKPKSPAKSAASIDQFPPPGSEAGTGRRR